MLALSSSVAASARRARAPYFEDIQQRESRWSSPRHPGKGKTPCEPFRPELGQGVGREWTAACRVTQAACSALSTRAAASTVPAHANIVWSIVRGYAAEIACRTLRPLIERTCAKLCRARPARTSSRFTTRARVHCYDGKVLGSRPGSDQRRQ
jgi:hypothetical protein